ncbi:MAG: RraA family protein, partial [Candidatus Latescibacteria bacterium]|nr:RraA family protein [Candidatus Latescibacterota bacterium]
DIERDFSGWLTQHQDELPVSAEAIQELLAQRTW